MGITVTAHALQTLQHRTGDFRPWANLEEEIVTEINLALEQKRVHTRKTEPFRLYGEKRIPLISRERFVWKQDSSLGWIIRQEGEDWIVMTTLTPRSKATV